MNIDMEKVVDNIESWLDVLDMDYPQAIRALKPNGGLGYCCLGLGGEFSLNLTIESRPFHDSKFWDREEMICSTGELPGATYQELGLHNPDGFRVMDELISCKSKMVASLVDLNDEKRYSFRRIRECLLVDLRTDAFGFFTEEARKAWRQRHGFRET